MSYEAGILEWMKGHEAYKTTSPVANPHTWARWLSEYGKRAMGLAKEADDAIKALLAEHDAMREALEMARAKIVTGGAGGWAATLATINAVLDTRNQNEQGA